MVRTNENEPDATDSITITTINTNAKQLFLVVIHVTRLFFPA
jgi:hypothetical protein